MVTGLVSQFTYSNFVKRLDQLGSNAGVLCRIVGNKSTLTRTKFGPIISGPLDCVASRGGGYFWMSIVDAKDVVGLINNRTAKNFSSTNKV